MRARLLLAGLLVSAAAMAAVEVTPLAGYRAGGVEIDTGIICVTLPCASFAESDDSVLYGAILGVPLNDNYQVEVLVNRQPTDLVFAESLGGGRNALSTVDFDVTHLHAGIMRLWRLRSFEPFVAVGAGQTWLDGSSAGRFDDRRWSGSAAAGARVPLGASERYFVRLEARGYLVDMPSGGFGQGGFPRSVESNLTQLETTVGVSLRF